MEVISLDDETSESGGKDETTLRKPAAIPQRIDVIEIDIDDESDSDLHTEEATRSSLETFLRKNLEKNSTGRVDKSPAAGQFERKNNVVEIDADSTSDEPSDQRQEATIPASKNSDRKQRWDEAKQRGCMGAGPGLEQGRVHAKSDETADSSDDEVEIIENPRGKTSGLSSTSTQPSVSNRAAKRFRFFEERRTTYLRKKAPRFATSFETRFVMKSSTTRNKQESNKRIWEEQNYNVNMSREDALREQERLFRESAERMRAQSRFHVTTKQPTATSPSFVSPVLNVHERHPNHWKFPDAFSRLGLPKGASHKLVKLHYRSLARVYHPDKSQSTTTAAKFQAIAAAYKQIMES